MQYFMYKLKKYEDCKYRESNLSQSWKINPTPAK